MGLVIYYVRPSIQITQKERAFNTFGVSFFVQSDSKVEMDRYKKLSWCSLFALKDGIGVFWGRGHILVNAITVIETIFVSLSVLLMDVIDE